MKKDRTITEKCQNCGEQYIPTRKGAQKFCSASCRSRKWLLKNQKSAIPKNNPLIQNEVKTFQEKPSLRNPFKIEKMSVAGFGNAFCANLATELVMGIVKNVFTTESNKTLTTDDIDDLRQDLNRRFFPVLNVSDQFGNKPFFDHETFKIVYYNEQLNRFELPIYDLG